MGGRWYNVLVVLCWLSTMGWLVTCKFLPSMLPGDPPVGQVEEGPQLIGWDVLVNRQRQPVGFALTRSKPSAHGTTEVHSLIHFDRLPLEELLSGWALLLRTGQQAMGNVQLENVRTRLILDPSHRLLDFSSKLGFKSLSEEIEIRGSAEGDRVKLSVHIGTDFVQELASLPQRALMGDMLSPQSQVASLHLGQSWKVESYSPWQSPRQPAEILMATVEGTEVITWGDRVESTWLVVYRTDPGARLSHDEVPRGQMWVRSSDGTVLRQEVRVGASTLTFVRLTDEEAAARAEEAWHLQDSEVGNFMDVSPRPQYDD